MIEILSKSWSYYRRNFLQLIISFCVTAVPLQVIIISSPGGTGLELPLAFLFLLAFLGSASINVLLIQRIENGKEVQYLPVLRKIRAKSFQLLGLAIALYLLLVGLLLLLSYFLSFLFSLSLLFVPVVTAFSLPEILLGNGNFMESVHRSLVLSWNNLLKTAVLVLLPGILVVYIWLNGMWILAWCFLIPFLIVTLTVLYRRLGPVL